MWQIYPIFTAMMCKKIFYVAVTSALLIISALGFAQSNQIFDFSNDSIPFILHSNEYESLIVGKKYVKNGSGEDQLRRYYGIRTEDFELIHFYEDIDSWVLYDLAFDPNKLNNVFNQLEYITIQNELIIQLIELQKEFQNTNFFFDSECLNIPNLIKNRTYTINHLQGLSYHGTTKNPLTDGVIENPGITIPFAETVWVELQEYDLDFSFDVPKACTYKTIEIRFLDLSDSLIFQPQKVELYLYYDHQKTPRIQELPFVLVDRPTGGYLVIYQRNVNEKGLKCIEIKAKNQGIIPEGYPDAGKPALLFIDEIIVH